MGKLKRDDFRDFTVWVLFMTLSQGLKSAQCQIVENNGTTVFPFGKDFVYNRLSNFTTLIDEQIGNQSSFCIKDPKADWNKAFNFSSDLDFVNSCIQSTRGDMPNRLCTAAEVKLYFSSFLQRSGSSSLGLNKNCNLTSWVSGCEPGWACSSTGSSEGVNFNQEKDMPSRTDDCQPCCAGFFCPRGITCMMPCPLGAFCPRATLNTATGMCDPYRYQLPNGQPEHTCGGANIWADVGSSGELFCSAGSFCPTTTKKISCSSGHYCRMGSMSEEHKVLAIRERRLARSREKAAKNARDMASVRARWNAAKDYANKNVIELKSQITKFYSFNKSVKQHDEAVISGHSPDDPSEHSDFSVKKTMHAQVHNPNDYEELNIEVEDKNKRKKLTGGKEVQTQSQIFETAYAQLEKEKVLRHQNENRKFSAVISPATGVGNRRRPSIEVAFKDVSLTLKGKKKHLLRYVSGTIRPGRITAVMGPSGAGKTTFLSALGGKATGCAMIGSITVNGGSASVSSYKKIIGYVPQDDIVHGNLTVEENLWFSARCRLAGNMPRVDRVLIVERVIESLGLQEIRGCLVGTVEKRQISGGQRKRVNVGLEMVIEPSLLILDEPTSGLDSSTSQLLLRALRHEAREGVTICMVVHQPSYMLFKMFDDLVLLAKGGLVAYHGPVDHVEEYFAGLGINVPDRVNPPDHFIDVLEGIVEPSALSSVSYTDLPLRWMLYNGYTIPSDLKQNAADIAITSPNAPTCQTPDSVYQTSLEHSFVAELWQDVKCNVELQQEKIRHNYFRTKDLSNRRTPGVICQYKCFLGRVGKQRLREPGVQAVDYLILLLAGACLGSLAKVSDQNFGALGYTYTIIGVSLLCKIAALRTFSMDKLQFWRESSSGMSILAYFLSKDTIDHFNTLVKPAVYLSMFYFFNNPRSSFAENYVVLLCLVYCVTGIAYALAILLHPGSAQLSAVLLPVVMTLIASRPADTMTMKFIADLCYPKWVLQAFVIANAERYEGVWLITRCGALLKSGYDLRNWGLCLTILMITGVTGRVFAFFCLLTFQKK
uniref:ABC transporter domain-containing protein n=1 Tax=Kalanchoe fedtschenkoi TaxID=63787 RepID=A0A7N0RHL0_KALFE